jgi:hypothetical protein
MYFTRDKIDRDLSVTIAVVEQPAGAKFNRGLIKNIGFKLLCNTVDYVCFHDVDYLPIWADYRRPDLPTMIVWDGTSRRLIDPGQPNKGWVTTDPLSCFGGVVLMENQQFERANGYPTQYWGWGFEDQELRRRLEWAGYQIQHRKGTFTPLDHVCEGYDAHDSPATVHLINQSLYNSRWDEAGQPKYRWQDEGLNSTLFGVGGRWPLALPPTARRDLQVERILVTITPPDKNAAVTAETDCASARSQLL